jgi:hypothetical protein
MDRVLMNRIAKASTRDFLDRLAAEVITRAPAMPAPGSEA